MIANLALLGGALAALAAALLCVAAATLKAPFDVQDEAGDRRKLRWASAWAALFLALLTYGVLT